jgi:uncharacterized protein YjbJ (UPF0337 family)
MEKAKGMVKEAAGSVMGDEKMKAEGSAEREGSTTEGDVERREGDTTEGHKEYYRRVIRESMERSGLD